MMECCTYHTTYIFFVDENLVHLKRLTQADRWQLQNVVEKNVGVRIASRNLCAGFIFAHRQKQTPRTNDVAGSKKAGVWHSRLYLIST